MSPADATNTTRGRRCAFRQGTRRISGTGRSRSGLNLALSALSAGPSTRCCACLCCLSDHRRRSAEIAMFGSDIWRSGCSTSLDRILEHLLGGAAVVPGSQSVGGGNAGTPEPGGACCNFRPFALSPCLLRLSLSPSRFPRSSLRVVARVSPLDPPASKRASHRPSSSRDPSSCRAALLVRRNPWLGRRILYPRICHLPSRRLC